MAGIDNRKYNPFRFKNVVIVQEIKANISTGKINM